MISRAFLLATILGGVIAVSAAEPEFEFTGVLTTGSETRIALTEKGTNVTTWLSPGQEYRGVALVRYDPKEEAVFLRKGVEERRLSLAAPRTGGASTSVAVAGQPVNALPAVDTALVAVRGNLQRLVAAARQYQQQHGATSVTFADLVGPGKMIPDLRPVAGENYSTLTFGPNVTAVSVTTATGATVSVNVPAGAPSTTPPAAAPAIPAEPLPLPGPGAVAPVSPAPGAAGPPPPDQAGLPTGPTSAPPTPPPAASADAAAGNTVAPAATAPNVVPSYTIQAGDTWERISTGTGIPVEKLRQLNPGLTNGTTLPTGQTLRLRE